MIDLKKMMAKGLKDARRTAEARPDWMKAASRFEGTRSNSWHGKRSAGNSQHKYPTGEKITEKA